MATRSPRNIVPGSMQAAYNARGMDGYNDWMASEGRRFARGGAARNTEGNILPGSMQKRYEDRVGALRKDPPVAGERIKALQDTLKDYGKAKMRGETGGVAAENAGRVGNELRRLHADREQFYSGYAAWLKEPGALGDSWRSIDAAPEKMRKTYEEYGGASEFSAWQNRRAPQVPVQPGPTTPAIPKPYTYRVAAPPLPAGDLGKRDQFFGGSRQGLAADLITIKKAKATRSSLAGQHIEALANKSFADVPLPEEQDEVPSDLTPMVGGAVSRLAMAKTGALVWAGIHRNTLNPWGPRRAEEVE